MAVLDSVQLAELRRRCATETPVDYVKATANGALQAPDPVSEMDVRRALWSDDGSYLL